MKLSTLREKFLDLFSDEDDPNEPFYDPAHLGAVIIVSLSLLGIIYWLLWTLLVFEGGLVRKISAAATVLFTSKTLADIGYSGSPYAMGPFEGWIGNLTAFILCAVLGAGLARLYKEAARKHRRK